MNIQGIEMKNKEQHRKGEPLTGSTAGRADKASAPDAKEQATEAGKPENSATTDECATLKNDLLALQTELALLHDKYLRSVAEFDNYRKRTLKEKMELSKTAGEEILSGFLSVIDDIDRAIVIMDQATDMQAMKEGILLINNKLKEFITQKGVKEIEAINTDFNTDTHEAITKIEVADEAKKGKVVDVIQKGYYLYDKVIRFAKVVVGY